MQALEKFNKKLDSLLKKYSALESENKRLKDTIAGQIKTIDKQNKKIAAMEHDVVSVDLNKGTLDDVEKENMRQQLDNVIGEIDKILNTLND